MWTESLLFHTLPRPVGDFLENQWLPLMGERAVPAWASMPFCKCLKACQHLHERFTRRWLDHHWPECQGGTGAMCCVHVPSNTKITAAQGLWAGWTGVHATRQICIGAESVPLLAGKAVAGLGHALYQCQVGDEKVPSMTRQKLCEVAAANASVGV